MNTLEELVQKAIERLKAEMGCEVRALVMQRLFGGNASDWGRIIKGHQNPKGEYKAKLKVIAQKGSENFWSNFGKYMNQSRQKNKNQKEQV